MASSSGNSSASNNTNIIINNNNNNNIDEDLQSLMEQRRRKRMESNRESARRSRQRKQRQLDDLANQASEIRRENARIAAGAAVTARHLAILEAENSVLRAQMTELTQRLNSLNDIVRLIDNGGGSGNSYGNDISTVLECETGFGNSFVMNSLVRFSQPIIANSASDMFLC